MSSVCRVCLAGNTRLHSLKNIQLIEVFEKLSNTKFNSEDARPRAVCYSCNQKLLRCHTLSLMVLRSEKIFSHLFHQGLETTQEYIIQVKQGMKQQFDVTTKQLITIDDNTTDEGSQVTIKDEPIPGILIKEEVITEQDKLIEVEFVPETITKSVIIPLEEDNSDRGNHVDELPSNSHVEQTKPDDIKMSLIKLFTCNVCNKQLKKKCHLVSHMRTHTGEKPFACHECDKQFNHKKTLVLHMRTHTNEKPFACHECDKRFNHKSSFVSHMRSHTGEKPFFCYICEKRFYIQRCLKRHMIIHTGVKPFACQVCDKQFNQKSNLVSHIKTHTGEKPFTCKECDKQFKHKSSLVSHIMRTHTGEQPFSCNTCDKQLYRKTHLVRHMRTHTSQKHPKPDTPRGGKRLSHIHNLPTMFLSHGRDSDKHGFGFVLKK